MNSYKRIVKYFDTFEEREEYFRATINNLIPRKYLGPTQFFRDMTEISIDDLNRVLVDNIAFITPVPFDSLAFSTPSQVIRAAASSLLTSTSSLRLDIGDISDMFQISEMLDQPIRTLSGGETVRLALCKAFILSYFSEKLIISSPFSWLSLNNIYLLEEVIERYFKENKSVSVLALKDEDSTDEIQIDDSIIPNNLHFKINIRDVNIPLINVIDLNISDPKYITVNNFCGKYKSPCLISGINGSGKSLTAYILCRAIRYEGKAYLECEGKIGYPRLLFQNIISQTLLRTFDQIMISSYTVPGLAPLDIYNNLLSEFTNYSISNFDNVPILDYDDRLGPRTLIQLKLVLTAIRLCTKPVGLILDEPDWGLSKESTIALAIATIKVSHSLGIPVLIISHKPWWNKIANSEIVVSKIRNDEESNNKLFQINLN